jgi:hypothetical protein
MLFDNPVLGHSKSTKNFEEQAVVYHVLKLR